MEHSSPGKNQRKRFVTKKLTDHHPGTKHVKLLFWNIQGLATKTGQLRGYFANFEIILLVETFVEEKKCSYIEKQLPGEYKWMWTPANRELARGRPWGGALIGVKEGIQVNKYWEEFKIGDCSLSDHFPLETSIKSQALPTENTPEWKWLYRLDNNSMEKYRRDLVNKNRSGVTDWRQIADNMLAATPRIRISTLKREPHWWNEECYLSRVKVKNQRKIGRITNDFTAYRLARKEYKMCILNAKRKMIEKQEAELRRVKTISEGWKYISKHKFGGTIKQVPGREELISHFKELLGASESQFETERQDREYLPISIGEEEFEESLKSLKLRKAAGVDQITAEMIKFADEATRENIRLIIERCLCGDDIPEEWRYARIHPLYKKGDPKVAKNYRGIAIVNVIYKLYAQVICTRLTKHCEDNGLLPDCQNGFRKRRSTIDSIYVLNHCIQSTLAKGKQLYAAFIDFKAAFDTVNRKKLMAMMEKLGIPKYLVQAIDGIYRKTIYHLEGTSFETDQGLRQGCPLSPLLFAIYTSDMDAVLRKWQSGGIVVGRQKIHMLAYADDVVILAHTPEELKDMLSCLLRYATARNLILSTEKSKVMRFSRNGVKSKTKWSCDRDILEEVNRFMYLGFIFQSNGSHTAHVKEMVARANRQVSRAWSIGERKFQDNFKVRMQLFQALVVPTLLYGSEVYGFQQYEEVEKIQRKYLRWTLGLPPWSRSMKTMAECRRFPLFFMTARRAMAYEERIEEMPCEILRVCYRESLKEGHRDTPRAVARRKFGNSLGYGEDWIAQQREAGVRVGRTLEGRHREQVLQAMAAEVGADESVDRLPAYLERGSNWRIIARFRMGMEERAANSFGDRLCRVCRGHDETLNHILECSRSNWTATVLLNSDGRGKKEMERILEWRKRNEFVNS